MAVVELTEAENGQTIRVHPDDEIVVRLPENPTTGFRWEIETADPVVTAVDDDFELGESGAGIVGAGGTRRFRFRVAASSASGRVALKLRQPWEGDASITDRFYVDVSVEP